MQAYGYGYSYGYPSYGVPGYGYYPPAAYGAYGAYPASGYAAYGASYDSYSAGGNLRLQMSLAAQHDGVEEFQAPQQWQERQSAALERRDNLEYTLDSVG